MLADDFDGDEENLDCIIGYVPRKENEMVAKMMDMGWGDAFTAELTTVKDSGAYDERLRMTIYIKSKKGRRQLPTTTIGISLSRWCCTFPLGWFPALGKRFAPKRRQSGIHSQV